MKPTEYATHIQVLGWLHIGLSAVLVVVGIFALLLFGGIGIASQDEEALNVLGCFGLIGISFFMCLAVPGLFAGYGLLKRRPWGRVVAIIVAAFNLFNIPIGTAIGIYALWLLTDEQAEAFFASAADANAAA